MTVKRFGCTTIHKKRYINASFIHSFTHLLDVKSHTVSVDSTFENFVTVKKVCMFACVGCRMDPM